jgi:hypothetical protein
MKVYGRWLGWMDGRKRVAAWRLDTVASLETGQDATRRLGGCKKGWTPGTHTHSCTCIYTVHTTDTSPSEKLKAPYTCAHIMQWYDRIIEFRLVFERTQRI